MYELRYHSWQNHPNYMAHMHLSLSLRPLTTAHESHITQIVCRVPSEDPESSTFVLIQDQHGVTTTLQHLSQK